MLKTSNSKNKNLGDFRTKQTEMIEKLIKDSDYTPIYQRYVCGMFTRSTDVRYKDNMIIAAEGGQIFMCSISELNTRNSPVVILRKTKHLSDFLVNKYADSRAKKFPCFDEFCEDTKNWLLENWKIQSYSNSMEESPINAFKSGNLNITPLTGRMIFEYLVSEENFDPQMYNLGLAKPGWFVRKYFFLSEEERLDLKEYSLEQLQNGRFSYVLYIIVFLDPKFWADDFKQILSKSPIARNILSDMIRVARNIRNDSLIFSGKLSDEIERNILKIDE